MVRPVVEGEGDMGDAIIRLFFRHIFCILMLGKIIHLVIKNFKNYTIVLAIVINFL